MGKYDHIAARTDDDIGDEEAGRMREKLAEESRARKAAEAARIKKANEENRKRLAGITARTDDGDGLIGGGSPGSSPGASPWKVASRSQSPKRDELGDVRDLLQQRFQDRIKEENKAHLERLAAMKPTIDDDTEDDATGEARARLRAESEQRRKAERATLRAKNAAFFARVKKVQAVTDNKIWDDGEGSAGAMRSVVAAQSRARKEEEAKQLAAQNAAHKKSLANVHAAVDDGDGIQF